jgi:hypothetical protein
VQRNHERARPSTQSRRKRCGIRLVPPQRRAHGAHWRRRACRALGLRRGGDRHPTATRSSARRRSKRWWLVWARLWRRKGAAPSRPGKAVRGGAGGCMSFSETFTIGGHTALARRWVTLDRSGDHHAVVLTLQPADAVESKLARAVAATGGSVLSLAGEGGLLRRAARLRQLATESADVVVLHAHQWDVVPSLAFAAAGGPPVLLLNHADHPFWLGTAIADTVIATSVTAGSHSRNNSAGPRTRGGCRSSAAHAGASRLLGAFPRCTKVRGSARVCNPDRRIAGVAGSYRHCRARRDALSGASRDYLNPIRSAPCRKIATASGANRNAERKSPMR